jgi:hypothetical protein
VSASLFRVFTLFVVTPHLHVAMKKVAYHVCSYKRAQKVVFQRESFFAFRTLISRESVKVILCSVSDLKE